MLKSVKKSNLGKLKNIIKRGYAFDVLKKENNILYIRQDGKEICSWRDIKARNTDSVGVYNFVCTSSIQEFTPTQSFEPFIVEPTENNRKLYFGDVVIEGEDLIEGENEKQIRTQNEEFITISNTQPYPLVTSANEYLKLNQSKYKKNEFYRVERPFLPDYESVRKISEEAHIPFRPWSLGYIPQTFEDENYICEPSEEVGNNLPLKAVILDSTLSPGEVSSLKAITAFGFYDNTSSCEVTSKFSWIVVGIREDSPLANQTNDLDDLQNNFPWFLAGLRMYLENYPSISVHQREETILTRLLNSKQFNTIGETFPSSKRFTHNFSSTFYTKSHKKEGTNNDWWVCGQPQFTEDTLAIVEKSIKKFNLKFK